MNSKKHYFYPSDIYLPVKDFEKWAVIACDQFTSEPEYWNEVEKYSSGSPSALNVTLPEIYLEGRNVDSMIEKINANMNEYLRTGILTEHRSSMIYVERTQSDGRVRKGIVGEIELSDYEYTKKSSAAIRATEATVIERIPPRVKIRRNASIELPHAMLLFDDPENEIMSVIEKGYESLTPAYNFDLMCGGGHVNGYFIPEDMQNNIIEIIDSMKKNEGDLLFAVGDGNHSLATAKECAKLSSSENAQRALVEIVNIHDEALDFEPIYRVIFDASIDELINDFVSYTGGEYDKADGQSFTVITKDKEVNINVKPSAPLPVGTLQVFLDGWLAAHPEAKIDYIHGTDSLRAICEKENAVGFIFDGMKKSELFPAVKLGGSLPRKTFSMGHARDKRYYLEARKIK